VKKQEREIYREFVKLGYEHECAVTLARRSSCNHPIFEIRHRKTGRTRCITTSSTSTSNTGRLNALAEAKRIMRQLKVNVPR